MSIASKYFLFSVDLEDVRDFIPNGHQYKVAVPRCTRLYLDWLDKVDAKCTFFVVGKTARDYPDLIKEIASRGHELACHTDTHTHLTKMSRTEFKADCSSFLETMSNLGINHIKGFRAPTFSMVERTRWVYEVLSEFGFTYSSSVLPSSNPIFGWPEFKGEGYFDGIYELPMNVGSWPLKVPFGGGVYFRFLPVTILRYLFNATLNKHQPVLSYFHPYDVDTAQERFMHPHLNDSKVLNWLMYVHRDQVFNKMEILIKDTGAKITRYYQYLEQTKKLK